MDKPIDFDARFTSFAEKWMREQLAAGKKAEQLEEMMPEVYLRFINQKADWLGGVAPAMYFQRYSTPEALIDLLRAYEQDGVDVPDLLLERITDLGHASVRPLMALAADESAPREMRVTALNLLIELDTAEPADLCVALVAAREKDDELADAAADLLRAVGRPAVDKLLAALDGASDEAAETFLELLCNFPGNPRVYEETERRFLADPERRALYASFLAKLGDARAIAPLTRAAALSELNYLDYIEIRNAIEELGGEAPEEREFAGDPYYESLKRLEK